LFNRTDLQLRWKTSAELLGRQVGACRQYEDGRAEQRPIRDGGDTDAELLRLDRDGNRTLFEHRAQRRSERRDHRFERLAQSIVPVRREARRPFRCGGERGQLACRRHAHAKQFFGMRRLPNRRNERQRLVAIDRLQHQELGDLRRAPASVAALVPPSASPR
jgi:hypothetical protein